MWLLIYTAFMSLVPFLEIAIKGFLNFSKLTMASFAAVDWMQVVDQVKVQIAIIWDAVVNFVVTHNFALLAPVFWFILLALVLLWFPLANVNPIPPEPDPKEKLTRRRHRAIARQAAKLERQMSAKHIGSIRTHGLHRRYPINLRAMGHFIRKNAPTLAERQQRAELDALHSKVAILLRRIDSLAAGGRLRKSLSHGPEDFSRPGNLRHHHGHPSSLTTRKEGEVNRPGNPPRRRAHGRFKSDGVYRPVTASGCHGLGNHRWTAKQLHAARKIAIQVNMATFPKGNFSTLLRMALQSTDRFHESMPEASTFPVIWDSGASISITHDRKDFVGTIKAPGPITQLQGIAKGLRIEGQGHVMWSMLDTFGNIRMIKVPAYLVSKLKVRLLSTTSLLQAYPDETIIIEAHQLTLSGSPLDASRGQVIARVNPANNLPTSNAHCSADTPKAVAALNFTLNTVHESNMNLTEAEKELLRWHHRLGHLSFRKIQFLMRTGVLSRSEANR